MTLQNQKNKIGFILTPTGWGGLEINVLKLANYFCARDWEVHLFVLENTRILNENHHKELKLHIIKNPNKYIDIVGAYRFSKILRKHQIKSLWVFANRDLDFAFYTKIFVPKLKIVYQQHMQIGIAKRDLLHTLRFSSIDYWITPLEILKKEVIAKTKLNPDKLRVVPLGTEIKRFTEHKYSKIEARNLLKISEDVLLLGILGRIDPAKGQLFLINAFEKIHQIFPSVHLLIMGEMTLNYQESEDYMKEIELKITTAKLQEYVHIRGFERDVSIFYNCLDIFTLASKGETYGMVTIEAMLSGIPVMATNTSGTPEILNYGEYGVLYSYNDQNDFIEKLTSLINSPELRISFSNKGQIAAIKNYSIENEYHLIKNEILDPIYLQ